MPLSIGLTPLQTAQFFYQFAALLEAGTSVQQSLNLAGKDDNPAFRGYLHHVSLAMDSGEDLASALRIDLRYFDSWTLGLIHLAEYSGSLPQTCRQLAIAWEAKARRKRLYRSVRLKAIATLWSLLILSAAIFNPNPTSLVNPEFWLRSLAIALLLLAIGFLASRYSSQGSRQLVMKLPILGKIVQAQSLLDLAQLRLPLSCGVPLLAALELTREHIPDLVMRANLSRAARYIRIGQPLSYALDGKLPPTAMEMIRTGEETGNLDAALESLAQYYAQELERRLSLLQRSLQPLCLGAIAALVAVVGVRGLTLLLNSLPD